MTVTQLEKDCGLKIQEDIRNAILTNIDTWESELPPSTIAVLAIHALRSMWLDTLGSLVHVAPQEQRMSFIEAAHTALAIDLASLEKKYGQAQDN